MRRNTILLLWLVAAAALNGQDSLTIYTPEPIAPPADIVAWEFFFDSDPGYGQAYYTAVADTDSLFAAIDTASDSLSEGDHVLGLRVRNANGAWSPTATHSFYYDVVEDSLIIYTPEPIAPPADIIAWEFFFDADPGYGQAYYTAVADTDSLFAAIDTASDSLSEGDHVLGLRVRNANGAWSPTRTQSFYYDVVDDSLVIYTPEPIAPPADIVAWEFFFDADPGYGQAYYTAVADTDSLFAAIDTAIDTLDYGLHQVGVRARNANGAWSPTSLTSYYHFSIFDSLTVYTPEPVDPPAGIVSYEFFISDSTGTIYGPWSSASYPPTDSLALAFNHNISGLGLGDPVFVHLTVYNEHGAFACYDMEMAGVSGEVDGVWDEPTWVNGDISVPESNSLLVTAGTPVYIWDGATFDITGDFTIESNGTRDIAVFDEVLPGHRWGGFVIDEDADNVLIEGAVLRNVTDGVRILGDAASPTDRDIRLVGTTIHAPVDSVLSDTGVYISNSPVWLDGLDIVGFANGIDIIDTTLKGVTVRNTRVRPNQVRQWLVIPDSLLATTGLRVANGDSVAIIGNDIAGFNTLLAVEQSTAVIAENLLTSENGAEYIGMDIDQSTVELRDNMIDGLPLCLDLTESVATMLRNPMSPSGQFTQSVAVQLISSQATLDRHTFVSFDSAIHADALSSVSVVNAIFRDNAYNATGEGLTTFRYTNAEALLPGEGNSTFDPLFTDAAAGDYTLQPGSPAIDAGDPLSPPDPDNSYADLGAYPYTHAVSLNDGALAFEGVSLGDAQSDTLFICNDGAVIYDAFTIEHTIAGYDSIFAVSLLASSLQPYDSLAVVVTFAPQAPEAYAETIIIHYAPNLCLLLEVAGTGEGVQYLSPPQNVIIACQQSGEVTLSWDAVAGAQSYRVFMSQPTGARLSQSQASRTEWSEVAVTADTQITLQVNEIYSLFRIVATDTPVQMRNELKFMSCSPERLLRD